MHFFKPKFLAIALFLPFLLAAVLSGCQTVVSTHQQATTAISADAASATPITVETTIFINTPAPAASPTASANAFTFLWAGDTLLDDAAQPLLDEHGYLYPFEYLDGYLEADCSILNLEGPITTLTEPWDPTQRWSYNANPLSAEALASMGFDAVSLANNHSLDRGEQGILDTFANLQNNGIVAFGAGVNVQQARKPVFIQTIYGKVAVIGFSQKYLDRRTAKSNQAGNLILSADNIREGYENARAKGAARVVAFVHWGENTPLSMTTRNAGRRNSPTWVTIWSSAITLTWCSGSISLAKPPSSFLWAISSLAAKVVSPKNFPVTACW
jgi:hypothetical protein